MLIQQGSLAFASFRDTGPQIAEQAPNFGRPVRSVAALLAGFDVQFVDDDHHLHLLQIDLRARNVSAQSVEGPAACSMTRDPVPQTEIVDL